MPVEAQGEQVTGVLLFTRQREGLPLRLIKQDAAPVELQQTVFYLSGCEAGGVEPSYQSPGGGTDQAIGVDIRLLQRLKDPDMCQTSCPAA